MEAAGIALVLFFSHQECVGYEPYFRLDTYKTPTIQTAVVAASVAHQVIGLVPHSGNTRSRAGGEPRRR